MSVEGSVGSTGFQNKSFVQADAGHSPNLAYRGQCRDRPRPHDPHEVTHGPGGSVDASVRELAGLSGRRTRQDTNSQKFIHNFDRYKSTVFT